METAQRISSFGLLEGTPECLLTVDGEDRIRFANARALELTGYARGALEGRQLDRVLPAGLGACVDDQPALLMCRRADGMEVPVEAHVGRFDGPEPATIVPLHDLRLLHT